MDAQERPKKQSNAILERKIVMSSTAKQVIG